MKNTFQDYLDSVEMGRGDVKSKKSKIEPGEALKRTSGKDVTPIPTKGEGKFPTEVAPKQKGKTMTNNIDKEMK